MATEQYPLVTFHFQVEWGGTRIGFTDVTGLTKEIEKIEYREGNSPAYHVTKMAGMEKFSTDITLKRGQFRGDNEFWQWLNLVTLNKPDRRTIIIKLLDETHAPVFTWTVANAFPIKVEGPAFKSIDNSFSTESITITFESYTVEAN
ncbi:MAG: phage tail protein [Bacteroidia bacterium]